MHYFSARSSVLVGLLVVGALACGADPAQESEEIFEPTAEAFTSGGCTAAAVVAAAPDAARRAVIERALKWIDDGVLYSQSATHEGYRRDCSGFVSMAWGLAKPGTSTAGLAPYDDSDSHAISWSEIEPGDAVNIRAGGRHHTMLFGRWLDASHTDACVLQENHTGTPANIRAYPGSFVRGFRPIRANHMKTASPTATPPVSEPSGAAPGAEAACSNDGECNPGSDGSGLVCEGGACVAGCRTNNQCPGSARCVRGSCR